LHNGSIDINKAITGYNECDLIESSWMVPHSWKNLRTMKLRWDQMIREEKCSNFWRCKWQVNSVQLWQTKSIQFRQSKNSQSCMHSKGAADCLNRRDGT
jgi:hypothetical protein